uniref:Peptidase S1 domain-containing protein n=1 Tax=Chelydra serpentina TaxID=8475 RepID=A0A8C3RW02_CHESE
MHLQILFLLPAAFLQPPGAQAGEIIGGRVAEPHSRPYMAYLQRKTPQAEKTCGGFLVREDFVLTAAHCLVEPAELNDAVYTIPLPQAGQAVEPGSVCSVAGWGKTSRYARTSILHEVELEVMADETCQEDELLQSYYKPSRMMCVGDPDEHKASFSGDSGGPLVCDGTAHGIVSFGKNDSSPPRVFTKVSAYVPWIKKTMKRLSSPGSHAESPASLH